MQASKHFIFMEALVRRILEDDAEHQLIHEEFYRLQAGLSGEAKLKNTLSDYSFRSEHATLFNFECINSRGFFIKLMRCYLHRTLLLFLR